KRSAIAQPGEKFPDGGIHVSDFPVIRLRCKPRFERLGRIVRSMWIVEMHPQEKRTARNLVEPRPGTFHNLVSTSFDAVVPILVCTTFVETSVVIIKSAIKPNSRYVFRIEHH